MTITVTRDLKVGIRYRPGAKWFFGDYIPEQQVRLASWTIRGATRPHEQGVVVSDELDENLVKLLTKQYGVVTVALLAAAKEYCVSMDANIQDLSYKVRRANGGSKNHSVTLSEYVQALAAASDIGNSFTKPSKNLVYIQSTNQVVYFVGIPSFIMLSMWNRYTNSSPLTLYVDTDEGVTSVKLHEEVAPLCTRYESLVSAGCLACPARDNCTESLLNYDLSVPFVSKERVTRLVSKRYRVLPPSDCKATSNQSPLSFMDMDMCGAIERNAQRSARRKAIAKNSSFYHKNCSSCELQLTCGSSSTYRSVAHDGTEVNQGMYEICPGKVPSKFEVTEDNYLEVFDILISSILIATERGPDLKEACLAHISSWVESSGKMPGHAAYYHRKLNGPDVTHRANFAYPIPRSLLGLAYQLGFTGSYLHNYYYYRYPVGSWLQDSSEELWTLLRSPKKFSDWVAILPEHQRVRSDTGYWPAIYECVDTLLLKDIMGVKNSTPSKAYRTKASRIFLATEFICYFLTPGRTVRYGHFGMNRAYLPAGLPGKDALTGLGYTGAEYNVILALRNLLDLPLSDITKLKVLQSNNNLRRFCNG